MHPTRVTCVFMATSLLFGLQGCKNDHRVEKMSSEDKIALTFDGIPELDDDEKSRQHATRKDILNRIDKTKQSESNMDSALRDARAVLSESRLRQLELHQNDWLKRGRGADINHLVRQGIPAADAFAVATQMRADFIQQRTSRAMLIDMPGTFGGFYTSGEDRTLELYEMPAQTLNLVMRAHGEPWVYTAHCQADTSEAQCTASGQIPIAVTLKKTDNLTLEIQTSSITGLSPDMLRLASLVEGQFHRLSPKDAPDVFIP